MSKFKVGDRVRRKPYTGEHGYLQPGQIFEVIKVDTDTVYSNGNWGHSFKNIELVVEETKDELDALIETQNKGAEAALQIVERFGPEVTKDVLREGQQWGGHKFRICKYKRKPKAPPIVAPTLVEGWAVTIDVGRGPIQVHIGCRQFDAADLQARLNYMVNREGASTGEFAVTRKGIWTGGNTLSWSSAEALLSYLDAVLASQNK